MIETVFERAYALAEEAFQADEVPVGAVIFETATGKIVADARNRTEERQDPLAH